MRDEMRQRFLRACRWLTWGSWEFGRGIDVDQDGGIDGSGWMLRLEPPRWLRAWARRQLPPPTEREGFLRRQDISDVLLAELIVRPLWVGALIADGKVKVGQTFSEPTLSWSEDADR